MNGDLGRVVDAAEHLSVALATPATLISLHRDLGDLQRVGFERWAKPRKKQVALRWGIFSWTYAATEAFFNDVLSDPTGKRTRVLPLQTDKLREAGLKLDVRLFTRDWGVRTRTRGYDGTQGNRSRWTTFQGSSELRSYLNDMKNLRDLLSHGGNPFSASNESGALWRVQKGNSMNLMGAEGFLQACCDLAGQTLLAFGGGLYQIPEWPVPQRSGLSAEKMPSIPLLP